MAGFTTWLLAGCVLAGATCAQTVPEAVASDGSAPLSDPVSTPTALPDGPPVEDAFEPGRAGRVASDVPFSDISRTNFREASLDNLATKLDAARNDAPGIRLGSFVLKPTLGQSINYERTKTGNNTDSRSYLETTLKGTLTSDWSRHQLTITGDSAWQRNISGSGETEPVANLDAELRLDLSDETTARLKAGYRFEREDTTDPNAVSNASVQSGIDRYSLGAGIERDFGLLRGSTKIDADRYVYGIAELENGGTLSLKDRNRNAAIWTTRIGYELSPALIPFIEASVGGSRYELRRDSAGFERSYDTFTGRGGLQFDLSEKLNGELALGYGTYRFKDSRLEDLSGVTLDGIVNWSPLRGTDIAYGLSTSLEPSTTPGQSGAMSYRLSSALTHELRSSLIARLSNSFTFRNYPAGGASDQTVWLAGAGLTWDINRALAMTGDVSYERTSQNSGPSTDVAKIGIGLTLRR